MKNFLSYLKRRLAITLPLVALLVLALALNGTAPNKLSTTAVQSGKPQTTVLHPKSTDSVGLGANTPSSGDSVTDAGTANQTGATPSSEPSSDSSGTNTTIGSSASSTEPTVPVTSQVAPVKAHPCSSCPAIDSAGQITACPNDCVSQPPINSCNTCDAGTGLRYHPALVCPMHACSM